MKLSVTNSGGHSTALIFDDGMPTSSHVRFRTQVAYRGTDPQVDEVYWYDEGDEECVDSSYRGLLHKIGRVTTDRVAESSGFPARLLEAALDHVRRQADLAVASDRARIARGRGDFNNMPLEDQEALNAYAMSTEGHML